MRKNISLIKKLFCLFLFSIFIIFIVIIIIIGVIYFDKTPRYVDLGGHFKYLNKGADFDFTGFQGDEILYKTSTIIFPEIEDYKFDEKYITARQLYNKPYTSKLLGITIMDGYYNKPMIDTSVFPVYDSAMHCSFESFYEQKKTSMRVKSFSDSVVCYDPYFKAMEKNAYNYYIIEKKRIVKHGPLSREEFEKQFKEKHLPSSLWIDE